VAALSVALTVIRAATGRLLPCIIIHLVFNAIQAAILLVQPYVQKVVPSSEPVNPTLILSSLVHLIR
jgi:membrane protease YdiL (CAAX protease family)